MPRADGLLPSAAGEPPVRPVAVKSAALRETRRSRGTQAQARGVQAEGAACAALKADGWVVLARRARTAAGEVDIVAERAGLLALVEVKARPALAAAAAALGLPQRARLLAAAEILLSEHPEWGAAGVRFDVMLVDRANRVRRIVDAFRIE